MYGLKPTGKGEAKKKPKAERKKAAKSPATGEEPEGRVRLKSVTTVRDESPVQEKSRKDIIDYIDPKFARQKRWKIEFDMQKNIRVCFWQLMVGDPEIMVPKSIGKLGQVAWNL